MKLLLEDANFCAAMNLLGKDFSPIPETQQKVEISICTLYNSQECTNTNEVRNKKWNRLTKDITKLPPSHDSAVLHIQRVNYQAAIWRRCLEAEMVTPSPEGHGWHTTDGTISIVWMTQDRAPECVLHVMKCSCKANQPCSTRRCSCKRRGMICTQLCLCSDECWNMRTFVLISKTMIVISNKETNHVTLTILTFDFEHLNLLS